MKQRTLLEQQIEKAFDYRGDVTISFKDGTKVQGFLYNRAFETLKRDQKPFIEVFLAPSGIPATYTIADIVEVHLTGEDHAAGKSYEEWLKKKNQSLSA